MSEEKGEQKKKGSRFLCFPHDQEEGTGKEKRDPRDHHPVLKSIATKMVKESSLWCIGGGGEDDCIILVKEEKGKQTKEEKKETKEKKKRKGWKRVGHSALIVCRYIGMGVTQVSPPFGYPSPEYYPDSSLWMSTSYCSGYTYHDAHPYWMSGPTLCSR